MKTLRLPHPPYDIFRSSRSAPGLYARQKWLQEASSPSWKADFDATVASLLRGQSDDGLWNGSPIETTHRLFGLHLTVRESNSTIDKGLDALLAAASAPGAPGDTGAVGADQLRGLPFAPGVQQTILLPAALFLATIFGRSSDPIVLEQYNRLATDLNAAAPDRQEPAALHNALRAFVVHPGDGIQMVTASLVDWLAGRQTPQGDWGPDIPFYQALNALAHLDTVPASRQCERAFDLLLQRQASDGTWGKTDRQWNTFLAIHALRNKELI
jgi:hypothetical protein